MSLIQLRDVVKRYDTNLAVDHINLDIEAGEIFGLLGPNGAGKSTAIKMIMGLLKPNHGELLIDGIDSRKEPRRVKSLLGLVPQDLAIYENISARENVDFFGSLYGLRGKRLSEATSAALAYVGLSDRQKDRPKRFSGGMKRRLNIACAIVHQPKIIIMDEPTVGIDPQSRSNILDSVRELNRRGSTVIYTSHYMEEVEAVCDRVGIIDHGKLIACGTQNELKRSIQAEEWITIEATDLRFNPIEEIKGLSGVKGVLLNENLLEINAVSAQAILQDVLFVLSKDNVRVRNISMKEPDLESVFLALTGRLLRD